MPGTGIVFCKGALKGIYGEQSAVENKNNPLFAYYIKNFMMYIRL